MAHLLSFLPLVALLYLIIWSCVHAVATGTTTCAIKSYTVLFTCAMVTVLLEYIHLYNNPTTSCLHLTTYYANYNITSRFRLLMQTQIHDLAH